MPELIKSFDMNVGGRAKRFAANNAARACLAVILLSDDPGSKKYVEMKQKACLDNNIDCVLIDMIGATFDRVKSMIERLNEDPNTHGIMVQHPFPFADRAVFNLIDPKKDVDGLTATSAGKMQQYGTFSNEYFMPATVRGVYEQLKSQSVQLEGKTALVIGRSNIVGAPMATMLRQFFNMNVINVHSKTSQEDIDFFAGIADLVVSAAAPNVLHATYIKPGATVFDCGYHVCGGVVCGDIDGLRDDMHNKHLAAYTPLYGSVGPMTIQCLLDNTVTAAYKQTKSKRGRI